MVLWSSLVTRHSSLVTRAHDDDEHDVDVALDVERDGECDFDERVEAKEKWTTNEDEDEDDDEDVDARANARDEREEHRTGFDERVLERHFLVVRARRRELAARRDRRVRHGRS